LHAWGMSSLNLELGTLTNVYSTRMCFWQSQIPTLTKCYLKFDRLHDYPGGLAKSHLVPLILNWFKSSSKQTVALKSKIEKRCIICRCSITNWP
jgi:hypothetical protein